MLRVLYEENNQQCFDDDNILQNMMLSDLYLNNSTTIAAAYSWVVQDNRRNFQDLEKFFRQNNFNTYLIARKIDIGDNFMLKTPNNNVEGLIYECYFCCKPKEIALQEVLDTCVSYDENFDNLSKSGNVCVITENIDNVEDKENNENSLIKKLMNNKIKLIFKKLNAKESIEQLSEDITRTTGIKPTISIIGKLNDDCPIMAFISGDGNMASNIAWSIKKENDETIYQLLDLNEYYAKNK